MDVPEPVTLPCGCFINCVVNNGVNELRFSPCRVDCVNFQNALELANEQAKPVEYRLS